IAWVLAGEFTFMIGHVVTVGGPGTCAFMPRDVPHAWKNTGSEIGRVLFLYTPAAASLRRSRNAVQPTTTNATNSSIATAGRSSAQARFEAGDFAQRADDKTPSLRCPLGAPLSDNLGI